SRLARARVISLALDKLNETGMHVERRDHQFFQARIAGETRKRVENSGHLLDQLRFAAKQTPVGVNAGGARVIIARPEMHIMPESIGIAPDDEQRFAVGLQPYHTVNDV